MCALRWDWEVPVPELDTVVFVVPRTQVKNGDRPVTDGSPLFGAASTISSHASTHPFCYRRGPVASSKLLPVGLADGAEHGEANHHVGSMLILTSRPGFRRSARSSPSWLLQVPASQTRHQHEIHSARSARCVFGGRSAMCRSTSHPRHCAFKPAGSRVVVRLFAHAGLFIGPNGKIDYAARANAIRASVPA